MVCVCMFIIGRKDTRSEHQSATRQFDKLHTWPFNMDVYSREHNSMNHFQMKRCVEYLFPSNPVRIHRRFFEKAYTDSARDIIYTARKHQVYAVWKWSETARNGIPRLTPHYHRTTPRIRPEKLQVVRQMPWDFPICCKHVVIA